MLNIQKLFFCGLILSFGIKAIADDGPNGFHYSDEQKAAMWIEKIDKCLEGLSNYEEDDSLAYQICNEISASTIMKAKHLFDRNKVLCEGQMAGTAGTPTVFTGCIDALHLL